MKVPVRNIFYLLAYAWDHWREAQSIPVRSDDCRNMEELFARVLSNGLSRLMKKGMKREHVTREEEMSGIKGKLEMTRSLQGMLFEQGKAACRYDDLSVDILPNRILKATVRQLLSMPSVHHRLKTELRGVYRLMGGISLVDLQKKDFEEALRQRNDRLYGILLRVCQFVHEQSGVDETTGERYFQDLLRDKQRMNSLFEAFVKNFYQQHRPEWDVGGERIAWDLDGEYDTELLPSMHTDISIVTDQDKLIIDTKYYKEALMTNQWGKERFKPENLYQLFAYLKNAHTKDGFPSKGMLLYPLVKHEPDEELVIQGHSIRICTVNLAKDWKDIEERLLGLLNGLR